MIFKASQCLTRGHRSSHVEVCEEHIQATHDSKDVGEGTMSPFMSMLAEPIPLSFDVVARPVVLMPRNITLWCPGCGAPIDRHQPNEDDPTQLLGTCSHCSRWFLLIEIEDVNSLTLVVDLPSADKILETVKASSETS